MDLRELNNGCIFDIQGFSVHDGPGCRTLVFLKGCKLKCRWCSNPEGIKPHPEPLYKESKCLYDLFCLEACPHEAISLSGNIESQKISFNRDICRSCVTFDCVKVCLTGALAQGGIYMTVDELYARIVRDRQYWGDKGGVTLTGGEPFCQPAFSSAFLKKCFEAYIHTAVETCGNVPWDHIEPSLPWLEWIFYDLKHMDSVMHRELTSVSNGLILENALKLGKEFGGRLMFRMPLVPGMNDSDENIRETAGFILSTGRKELNVLPVHHLGREKYHLAGMEYSLSSQEMASKDALNNIREKFSGLGIQCYLGSETPF